MNKIFTTILCLILVQPIFAEQYQFVQHSIEKGLVQSQVNCIYQDNLGHIWVGTYGGISKYDGTTFQNFTREDGILSEQVYSIVEDDQKRLWFGVDGGLMSYHKGEFSNYAPIDFPDVRILSITQINKHQFLLGTNNHGVLKFDLRGKELYSSFNDEFNYVRAIHKDSENNVWIGDKERIICQTIEGEILYEKAFSKKANSVYDIAEDKDGTIWFAVSNSGLYQYKNEKLSCFSSKEGLHSFIKQIDFDQSGAVVLATNNGMITFKEGDFNTFSRKNGLEADKTKSVFVDKEQNIWVGSNGQGLFRFMGEEFTSLGMNEGLKNDIALAMFEDKAGNKWVSNYKAGITILKKDGSVEYITHKTHDLPSLTIWDITQDEDGTIFLATSRGLSLYKDGKLTNEQTLGVQKIYSVYNKDGDILIGTKKGVFVYNNGTVQPHYTQLNIDDNIININEDKEKNLWLSTNKGVYKCSVNDCQQYDESIGLSEDYTYNTEFDNNGNTWVGTKFGLNRIDESGEVFKYLLPKGSNLISFIKNYNNELWIGTNKGTYKMSLKSFQKNLYPEFEYYGIENGMVGLESNQNSTMITSEGTLWMGTNRGIAINNFSKISERNTPQVTAYIKDVKLNYGATSTCEFKQNENSIKLPNDQNHITFEYKGILHKNPKTVQYSYLLEGFDEEWNTTNSRTDVTYSNLPPGEYTFKVKATANHNFDQAEEKVYHVSIIPAYYQTALFKFLMGIMVLGMTTLIVKYFFNKRRKAFQTKQLGYKAQLLQLEHQVLNAMMNPHFIFNALNSIQYFINVNDKLSANRFLAKFAKLIRKNLDSTNENVVSLKDELERLELYLSLENMRFEKKFSYKIVIDENIDLEKTEIAPMMLQPYVENSIWHGLMPKNEAGEIKIEISKKEDEQIFVSIQDNGIGINTSLLQKNDNKKAHISKGMSLIGERARLLGQLNSNDIKIIGPYELKNINNNVLGTQVDIILNNI